ncbi:hypothetical protein ACHAXH_004298 [Discostella pseudostelligera]
MRTSAFAIALATLCPASANAADLIRKRTSPITQRVSTASSSNKRRANNDSDPFHRLLVAESLSFSMAADIEQADISLSLVLEVADISMSLPEDLTDIASLSMPSDEPTPLPEEPQIDVLPEGPEALPAPLPPNPVVSSGFMVGTTVSALVATGAILLL